MIKSLDSVPYNQFTIRSIPMPMADGRWKTNIQIWEDKGYNIVVKSYGHRFRSVNREDTVKCGLTLGLALVTHLKLAVEKTTTKVAQ